MVSVDREDMAGGGAGQSCCRLGKMPCSSWRREDLQGGESHGPRLRGWLGGHPVNGSDQGQLGQRPQSDTQMCDLGRPTRRAERFLSNRLHKEEGMLSEPGPQAGCMLPYLPQLWEHTQSSWLFHRAQPAHPGHLDKTKHQLAGQLDHPEMRDVQAVRSEHQMLVEDTPGKMDSGGG